MASVTYKINGKYDGKAVSSAKKDFEGLGSTVKNISNTIKGLALFEVGKKLLSVANQTKTVFLEQNKALQQFNIACRNANADVTKLNNLKNKLSHNNFIDDDSLNSAIVLGQQMGLNAEQLEKVTEAAVNMAAAGVKPLNEAMKDLSKTVLKNESEFDEVAKRYNGFAEAMSNTFSGRNTQWKNSVSDLQAAIGAIPQALSFLGQGNLLQPLNDVTDWLVDNRNQIINFFLHLPEVFKTVARSIADMTKRMFENFPEYINSVGVYFVMLFKDGLKTIFDIATETFKGMMSLLDFAIGNPFRSSKNFINTMLNNLIEGINGLASKLPDWAKNLFGIKEGGAISYRFDVGQNDANKTWSETARAIEKSMNNVVKAYKDGTKKTKDDWLKILDGTKDFFSDDLNSLKSKLAEILGQDLPKELQQALDGVQLSVTGLDESKDISAANMLQGAGQVGTVALSNLGELGEVVNSAMSGGIWGAIATIIGKILGKISEFSPLFAWFQNIFSELLNTIFSEDNGLIKSIERMIKPFLDGFNAVRDILGGLMNFLAGIIDSVTPILAGFTKILNYIAPLIASIFNCLSGLFELVGVIGELLNPLIDVVMTIVKPILQAIEWVLSGIYWFIASLVNAVIDIYNWFQLDEKNKKAHISTEMPRSSAEPGKYETYTPNLADYTPVMTGAGGGGSASYTAAKDIYVNINFANSYVNGDARTIALMLRDEIRSAERLGY